MTRVLALSGGVGGAKLALGLQYTLAPGELTVAVNTGDDFEHLGLAVSPDIDTTLYTLAGLSNAQLGWGRADESWHCMTELDRLGGETWFRLGDKDLAVHLQRTRRLAAGDSLEVIISGLARSMGLATSVIPMSNDRVRTVLTTDAGVLAFQDYFVRRQCKPIVRTITYEGAANAHPAASLEALFGRREALEAIIICPSNPYLSIDPMLAIPQLRAALRETSVPVVAVSPLIAGKAVKGPTAKLMSELALDVSSLTIARHYDDVIDGMVLDPADRHLAAQMNCAVHFTPTLMSSLADKSRLAAEVLEFSQTLRSRGSASAPR